MDSSERAPAQGTMATTSAFIRVLRDVLFSVKNRMQPVASDGLLPYLCTSCGRECSRTFILDLMSVHSFLRKHAICFPVWKKFHIRVSYGCRHLHKFLKLVCNKAAVLHNCSI